MKIHTTIGVYANGDYKSNGVNPEHLEEHIQYNKDYRPGRALFVDGVCVNQGYLSDEEVADWTEKLKDEKYKKTKCTSPYH